MSKALAGNFGLRVICAFSKNKKVLKPYEIRGFRTMVEKEGFEPSLELPPLTV
jgi:hypothetical protein